MKYIIILASGLSEVNFSPIGTSTPALDELAFKGQVGMITTVPRDENSSFGIAALSLLGYETEDYTGRSAFEAICEKIDYSENDTTLSMNLISVTEDDDLGDRTMLSSDGWDVSAGDAARYIKVLQNALGNEKISFHSGYKHKNCLIIHNNVNVDSEFFSPSQIEGQTLDGFLPKGNDAEFFIEIMDKAFDILNNHAFNQERAEEGLKPINGIWLWGKGTKPHLKNFKEKFKLNGAVVSPSFYLQGVGINTGMDIINIPTIYTNQIPEYMVEAHSAIDALNNHDFVFLHIETDKISEKETINGITKLDNVVKYVKTKLAEQGDEFCIAVLPNPYTQVKNKNKSGSIPFIVYNSVRPAMSKLKYLEPEATKGIYLSKGSSLIQYMLQS